MTHFWAAAAVFGATYLLLSFQTLPGVFLRRPAASLLGAVAMVCAGVVSLPRAYSLVDMDTLVFILGMMIVIGYLEVSGFFEQVEVFLLQCAKTPRQLLGLVVASAGLLSALFMNDTVCLMLTPLVLRAARKCRRAPAPYLIALATASNIGSAFTPMGNPQNMIVAVHSQIPFLSFVWRLAPLSLLGLWLDYLVLVRAYPAEFAHGGELSVPDIETPPVRGRLIYACLGTTAALLLLLCLDVHPPLAAIVAAAALILAGATKPREAFAKIDWELLLMFACLFVVMGGVRESGLLAALRAPLERAAKAGPLLRLGALSAVSAALSNLVSNVPAVVFLSNLLPAAGADRSLWLALAASSTLAGNLTLIGSVANLIVFESAREECRVGFWEYARAAAPLAAALVVLSTLWLTLVG